VTHRATLHQVDPYFLGVGTQNSITSDGLWVGIVFR
jgi:hypothetical protein